jgi:enamine deaminase RidA (YjgF/YER057c/UK114 family)
MTAEEKLAELGLILPDPPQPAGAYTRAVRWGDLLLVSGQLPLEQGHIRYAGRVGSELSVEEGYAAARLCALNGLSILKAEAGGLERVARILRLGGFVASADGFTDQAKVVNGASELFSTVLGPRGIHARLAVGVSQLPLGAAVELEIIAALG